MSVYREIDTYPVYRDIDTYPVYREIDTYPVYREIDTYPVYREIDTCLQRYSNKIFRDIPIMHGQVTHNS